MQLCFAPHLGFLRAKCEASAFSRDSLFRAAVFFPFLHFSLSLTPPCLTPFRASAYASLVPRLFAPSETFSPSALRNNALIFSSSHCDSCLEEHSTRALLEGKLKLHEVVQNPFKFDAFSCISLSVIDTTTFRPLRGDFGLSALKRCATRQLLSL